ncbi:PTS sugar transporter subunit IIB [Anaerocolumna jejuensis]|uniref:PTS sugar transporter subunit IIB n=1 Tax=Anaerocolumna jejuensis TaxID=259063 RepID=UPI003F7BECC1
MKKVLLICGTGASSGFMAKSIRKAAKDKGKNVDVKARSDSELDEYIEEIDLLLVGPHLKYMLDDLKKEAKPYNISVEIISEDAYGTLDGNAVLMQIESLIEL